MRNAIKQFVREEAGLETVEWAIVGSLVVIAAIVAFTAIGQRTSTLMQAISDAIPPAGGSGS